jgi:hypothetical protein
MTKLHKALVCFLLLVLSGLFFVPVQAAADKTALIAANNAAIIAYYEETDSYTLSSHESFKTAVSDYGNYLYVNTVIADDAALQETVDALVVTINAALALLVPKANVTLLEDAYSNSLLLDLSVYTPASVTLFQTELDRIHGILIGDDTDQTLCDQTLIELGAAADLLVSKADKAQLQAAYNHGIGYKAEKYTVTSYYILSGFLDTAETVLADPDITQTVVDQLILDLADAVAGLRRIPNEPEMTVGKDGFNIANYVTVGNSTISNYVSSNPSIVHVDAVGNLEAVSFGHATITVVLANGVSEVIPIFVKEKVTTTTIILMLVIPILAIGTTIAMILVNTRPVDLMQRVKNIRKPKKITPAKTVD